MSAFIPLSPGRESRGVWWGIEDRSGQSLIQREHVLWDCGITVALTRMIEVSLTPVTMEQIASHCQRAPPTLHWLAFHHTPPPGVLSYSYGWIFFINRVASTAPKLKTSPTCQCNGSQNVSTKTMSVFWNNHSKKNKVTVCVLHAVFAFTSVGLQANLKMIDSLKQLMKNHE